MDVIAEDRTCPVCRRTFAPTATPTRAPVPAQIYCGPACRDRNAHRARHSIAARWARCSGCGADFWQLSRRLRFCPPPTPASARAPSPRAMRWQEVERAPAARRVPTLLLTTVDGRAGNPGAPLLGDVERQAPFGRHQAPA